ncbi:protein ripply2 [Esox lucius]|uniref:Protein ripply2 n=1 Tax=Esox lucius TaxID=8010 RepID=A0A3P9A6Z3_ESOLU|nr:protein ripply2 [Esox lucius]
MENIIAHCGFSTNGIAGGANFAQQPANLWRPWDAKADRKLRSAARTPYTIPIEGVSDCKDSKSPKITHPVKLFWPKSRCFDYLYQEAEMLLRNYPVQASICLYEDSSSDDEEDGSEEEEDSIKEIN